MFRKVFLATEAIPERSTYQYRTSLLTSAGDPVEPGQVVSILATLRDLATGTFINTRTAQEVKGQNGGVMVSGEFSLQFESADTPIVGAAGLERHVLTLDFRLVGGGRVTREVWHYVANFADITV